MLVILGYWRWQVAVVNRYGFAISTVDVFDVKWRLYFLFLFFSFPRPCCVQSNIPVASYLLVYDECFSSLLQIFSYDKVRSFRDACCVIKFFSKKCARLTAVTITITWWRPHTVVQFSTWLWLHTKEDTSTSNSPSRHLLAPLFCLLHSPDLQTAFSLHGSWCYAIANSFPFIASQGYHMHKLGRV